MTGNLLRGEVDEMDVINKLNQLRLERNMSVYRLAELSGINQSTLANTFSRGTVPSIKHLELICEALGVSMSQFFAEDEELMPLTSEEIRMIKNYRKLPLQLRQSINATINSIPEIRN